jgi:hypothetical protein
MMDIVNTYRNLCEFPECHSRDRIRRPGSQRTEAQIG